MNEPLIIGPCTLYCGSCFDFLPKVEADCIITDPPFSERTHAGHDMSDPNGETARGNFDGSQRQALGYSFWTPEHVEQFCMLAECSGWIVIITDHILARSWEASLRAFGRYVFAPLPHFCPGRSVRLAGDGPSSWTDQIVVARTKAQLKWGTLPGGYVTTPERGEDSRMGGKPIALMTALVSDYSEPGNTIFDPCAGMATTAIACIRTGRKFVGCEIDPEIYRAACDRIRRELQQQTFTFTPTPKHEQPALI